MNNRNQHPTNFDRDYEPDISNVLQNTFVSRVPDENDENQEPVTTFNGLTENNIGKPLLFYKRRRDSLTFVISSIGKKVSIRGLITHASGIKLFTLEVSFRCIECQEIQTLGYNNEGKYYYLPLRCKSGCKNKQFTPIIPTMEFDEKDENSAFSYLNKFRYKFAIIFEFRNFNLCVYIFHRMQEAWNESENDYIGDSFPKIIDCEIRNNLVDKVKPGDFVVVKGKLQVHEVSGEVNFLFFSYIIRS
jgi:DNA replicative helicase MCM subunit Mcm2 (Cdc46/Mcm family)